MPSYVNARGLLLRTAYASTTYIYGTAATEILIGTDANNMIASNGGGDTLIGGRGDDTYYVSSTRDRIVEYAGQGIDSVTAYSNYVLPDHVETLEIEGSGAWYAGGNALDNILISRSAKQHLDGGAGNDVLVGSTDTTFIVKAGNGSDMIYNWNTTSSLRLTGYGVTSFAQFRKMASQWGDDTALNFGNGETLVLSSTRVSDLKAAQFDLQIDMSKMKMLFGDEFDTLSLWNKGKGTWWTEYGYGWGPGTVSSRVMGDESQIYMEAGFNGTSPKPLNIDPFSISNGVLAITAAPTPVEALPYLDNRTYTSGLLSSKQVYSQLYGYFEIKAQMPAGQGFWPSFWLLPADDSWPPEIDVFEQLGKDPTTIYSTTHYVEKGNHLSTQDRTYVDTTQWHVYGVNWTPDSIVYTVDGTEVARQATPKSFDKEMFMLANLAVGGVWSGAPDATTGTGQMKIDYIHAYQTEDTVSTTINGVHTVYNAGPKPPPVNRAPVVIAGNAIAREDVALSVTAADGVLKGASDPDGDAFTAALRTDAAHGKVKLAADGSFTYLADANYNGADSFTFAAVDAAGATSLARTFTIAVGSVNDAPVARNDAGFTTAFGVTLRIGTATLLSNDSDVDGDPLSIVAIGGAQHGTVALVGNEAVFTPEKGYSGSASFTYTATDNRGGASIATVSLGIDKPAVTLPPVSPYISGSSGADVINKAGTTTAWMINGGAGNDVLTGGSVNDSLNGAIGNDVIDGGGGDDMLTGGTGADTITGGSGNDIFLIRPGDLNKANGTLDRITDFSGAGSPGGDLIQFLGFSPKATLTLVGSQGGYYQYHLEDGASSGDFLINTNALSTWDMGFY